MEGAEVRLTSRARTRLDRQLRFSAESPPTNELGDPMLDKISAEPLGQLHNCSAPTKDGHERGVSTAEQVALGLNNETCDGMRVEAGVTSIDPHGQNSTRDTTQVHNAAINNGLNKVDAAAVVAADGVQLKNNASGAKEADTLVVEVAVAKKTDEVGFSAGVVASSTDTDVEPEGGGRGETGEQQGVEVPQGIAAVRLDVSGAFWRSPECDGMVVDPPIVQAASGSGPHTPGLFGGILNMAMTLSTAIAPKATPHVAQKVGQAVGWLSQRLGGIKDAAAAAVQTTHKKRRKKKRRDRGGSAPAPTDSTQGEAASDSEGEGRMREMGMKALTPEVAGGGKVTPIKADIKDTVLEPAKETGEKHGAQGTVNGDKAVIMERIMKRFMDNVTAHKVERAARFGLTQANGEVGGSGADVRARGQEGQVLGVSGVTGLDAGGMGVGGGAAAAHMCLCIIDPALRMSPATWESYAQAALEGREGGADEKGGSSADDSDFLSPEMWERYAQAALEGGEGDAEEEGGSWSEVFELVVAIVCDGATAVCDMLQDAMSRFPITETTPHDTAEAMWSS